MVTRKVGKKKERKSKFIFLSQDCPFGTYIKTSTHPLFATWSPLLVHVRFTSSKERKGFSKYICCLETVPWNQWSLLLRWLALGKPQQCQAWNKVNYTHRNCPNAYIYIYIYIYIYRWTDKVTLWGPLHTRAKGRHHEIVRAQKKSVQRPSQHTSKIV
jgi:hypothetical protein